MEGIWRAALTRYLLYHRAAVGIERQAHASTRSSLSSSGGAVREVPPVACCTSLHCPGLGDAHPHASLRPHHTREVAPRSSDGHRIGAVPLEGHHTVGSSRGGRGSLLTSLRVSYAPRRQQGWRSMRRSMSTARYHLSREIDHRCQRCEFREGSWENDAGRTMPLEGLSSVPADASTTASLLEHHHSRRTMLSGAGLLKAMLHRSEKDPLAPPAHAQTTDGDRLATLPTVDGTGFPGGRAASEVEYVPLLQRMRKVSEVCLHAPAWRADDPHRGTHLATERQTAKVKGIGAFPVASPSAQPLAPINEEPTESSCETLEDHANSDATHPEAPPEEDSEQQTRIVEKIDYSVPAPSDKDCSRPTRETTRRLIMDPLQWLSQAPDTPLMEEAILRQHLPYYLWGQNAEAVGADDERAATTDSGAPMEADVGHVVADELDDWSVVWSSPPVQERFWGSTDAALTEVERWDSGVTEGIVERIKDGVTASASERPTAESAASTTDALRSKCATIVAAVRDRSLLVHDDIELPGELLGSGGPQKDGAAVTKAQKSQQQRPEEQLSEDTAASAQPSNVSHVSLEVTGECIAIERPAAAPLDGVRVTPDGTSSLPTHASAVLPVNNELATVAHSTAAVMSAEQSRMPTGSTPFPPVSIIDPTMVPDANRLVYNVFNRRVCKSGATSILALGLLGITVDSATRQLTVSDPGALFRLRTSLREGRISWPKAWSRGVLYRQLERYVTNDSIADPAAKITTMLKTQYVRLHSRRAVGYVSSAGESTTGHSATLLAAEEDKLLSLGELNEEQQRVVQFVLQGHHTYIGGGAGTGKSVLLRVLKQQLIKEGLSVAVTGTTGVSSSHIGGCTLHHCFGINIHGEFTRRKELSAYDVVIIDEVSMLPRDLFEALERQLRRHNGVDLPFGGVQMILCGDFLQLGAIASEPIINSAVFRSNFAMLKLTRVVRQSTDPVFVTQLQELRRGIVPERLRDTVNFLDAQSQAGKHDALSALHSQQRTKLRALGLIPPDTAEKHSDCGGSSGHEEQTTANTDRVAPQNPPTTANAPGSSYVDGAVNLLPTNKQVYETNQCELAKLAGEPTVFEAQILAPSLTGRWSPTYILRLEDPKKLQMPRLRMVLGLFLESFFQATDQRHAWTLGDRHLVLYPLFVDALVLRVRIPAELTDAEVEQFVRHMSHLEDYVARADLGVQLCEIMESGDGLHTERDEHLLHSYAQHAPMTRPLTLKVGCRVMLRANLAPGLVNGSLGTVTGFRRLTVEDLPRYLLGNAQREDAVRMYADFLCYEHGFATAVAPEVDFGSGRVEVIPPLTYYVGGLHSTHFYSTSVITLPLSLAYAFTVHKVQGLTLVGRVHLELSRMWPCEHLLYVAMSRVRNPEQLSVSNFSSHLVRVASDCLLFDDSVPSVEQVKVMPHFIPATWNRAPHRRKRVQRRRTMEALLAEQKMTGKARAASNRRRLDEEIEALQAQMLGAAASGDRDCT